MKRTQLSRRFLLDVWKNGAVTIRETGERLSPGRPHPDETGGLPVFSTDTRDEAESIIVYHCRLSRIDNETYFLNEFSGEIEDLDRVTQMFDAFYKRLKQRKDTPSQPAGGAC